MKPARRRGHRQGSCPHAPAGPTDTRPETEKSGRGDGVRPCGRRRILERHPQTHRQKRRRADERSARVHGPKVLGRRRSTGLPTAAERANRLHGPALRWSSHPRGHRGRPRHGPESDQGAHTGATTVAGRPEHPTGPPAGQSTHGPAGAGPRHLGHDRNPRPVHAGACREPGVSALRRTSVRCAVLKGRRHAAGQQR